MIADAKLTGSIAKGISVARYMLDPDAKQQDSDVKTMQKAESSERVLHIETDLANPILITDSPKASAQSFIREVVDWNQRNRPGKKAQQSQWEHRVISFHPSDSQKLNAHTACKIARESLGIVAHGQRPSLFVVHGDTAHLHVHMLYGSVDQTGKIHNPHQDFRMWEQAMEQLEIKYDLYRVDKRLACADRDSTRMPDGTNPKKSEYRMTQRTGEPSCKQRLRRLLDEAIGDSKSSPPEQQFARFLAGLQSKKIGVSANIQSTGRVAGLRLHYGIFSKKGIKASALGKAYSWNQLAKRAGFEHNSPFNTTLLKLSDRRIKEWIQHDSGGKKSASQMLSSIHGSGNKAAPRSNVKALTSTSNQAFIISPEFPDEYPEFLKEYIRAIVRAANSEMSRQQQRNNQLNDSIETILELLASFQQRAIKNHLKHHRPDNVYPSTSDTPTS
ncbi:relaxase/mobilization nuclease domain-containing protein [Endozoicomonas acroporae]|uniref:relaxase/mobilization nuclease domain-containing protein n=1 Tax=Endozoicomonas acroporae TaxID=1701104 RepID=UPI000C75EA7A|nr:relaxase/mobilization nuclease domain-containing protein [Endozoicomonas acroporae]